MASIRQIAANRLNATHSTGPTSADGKVRARRNALKHGLSGQGVVLPDESEELILDKSMAWRGNYERIDVQDCDLIAEAAREFVRMQDCQRIETSLRIKQCQRAETHWELDRREDAKALLAKLHRNPMILSGKLESTLQGCELMIERWDGLLTLLENGEPWKDEERSQALDLLGVATDFRRARSKVDPRPGESKVEVQKRAAESEIVRLMQLKEDLLIGDDEDDREEALLCVGPPHQSIVLIRRYESTCHKRFQFVMQQLEPKRPQPETPEPREKRVKASSLDRTELRRDTALDALASLKAKYPDLPFKLPESPAVTFGLGVNPKLTPAPIDERARRAKRPDPKKLMAEVCKQKKS